MLQIEVNHKPLVLSPNTQIRFEENFPYFEPDAMPASIVWHFDVPIDGNQDTFKYAQVIQVFKRTRLYHASIKVHGIPIADGIIHLTNAGQNYRINMQLNTFASDFEGVNVNELSEETAAFNLGASMTERLANSKAINAEEIEAPFRFPMVYAPRLYGEDDDQGNPENNAHWMRYINNYENGAFVANQDNGRSYNTLIPFFFLKDTLRMNLQEKRWSMTGSLLNDLYFSRILLHNNCTLDENNATHLARVGYQVGGQNLVWGGGASEGVLTFNRVMIDETTTFEDGIYSPPEAGQYRINGKIDFYSDYFTRTSASNSMLVMRFSVHLNLTEVYSQSIYMTVSNPRYVLDLNRLVTTGLFKKGPLVIDVLDSTSTIYMKVEFVNFFYVIGNDPLPISADFFNNQLKPNVEDTTYVDFGKNESFPNRFTNINYNNHLPSENLITLLNEARKAFCSVCFFDSNSREVEAQLMNDVLKNTTPLDLSEFAEKNGRDVELLETGFLQLSFSQEAEREKGFYYEDLTGNNLPELPFGQLKSERYAYTKFENAIYVSKEVGTEVVWEFLGTLYHIYNKNVTGKITPVKVELIPVPMASFRNVSPKTLPFYDEMGQSPLNPQEPEPMDLEVSAWEGLLKAYPYASSNGCYIYQNANNVPYHIPFRYDFDFTLEGEGTLSGITTLMRYWKQWEEFQRNRNDIKVPLVGLGLIDLLNIIRLNRPRSEKRWVSVHGVKALPRQFTAIIDVQGNVKEAELIMSVSTPE